MWLGGQTSFWKHAQFRGYSFVSIPLWLYEKCEKDEVQSLFHHWYSLLYNCIKLWLTCGEDRLLEAGTASWRLKEGATYLSQVFPVLMNKVAHRTIGKIQANEFGKVLQTIKHHAYITVINFWLVLFIIKKNCFVIDYGFTSAAELTLYLG